jgi:NAD(P)-dependent dehydrogenase (short-subunit alcohol dehydrogenase family)
MASSGSTPPAPVSAEAQAQPVALITGAAGGIGRAAAVQFAESGCRVVVVDVDESGAQDTCTAVEGEDTRLDSMCLCIHLQCAAHAGACSGDERLQPITRTAALAAVDNSKPFV